MISMPNRHRYTLPMVLKRPLVEKLPCIVCTMCVSISRGLANRICLF